MKSRIVRAKHTAIRYILLQQRNLHVAIVLIAMDAYCQCIHAIRLHLVGDVEVASYKSPLDAAYRLPVQPHVGLPVDAVEVQE